MRWTIPTMLILALACGCQNNKKTDEKASLNNGGVLDVTPAPAPVAAPAPIAVQPVIAEAPAAPAATAAGQKYTVKKGDTLWSIAAAHYGNGNQWQKITHANAGLSPETLKAGQTIKLP